MTASQDRHSQAELLTHSAWTGTAVAAAINALGMGFERMIERSVPEIPAGPSMASAAVGAALLGILYARRKKVTIRFCSAIFLINSIAIVASLYLTSAYFATLGTRWVPFQANNLGCLLCALLAPTAGMGIFTLLIFGGTAVIQYFLFSDAIRSGMAVGMPWTTVAFAFSGAFVLWFRIRRQQLENNLVHARTEIGTARNVARAFLQLRDIANTPIQTILLTVGTIEKENPELAPQLSRISRALARLEEINLVLSRYEEKLIWRTEDLSPDSDEILK